jgi:hypothetical protein
LALAGRRCLAANELLEHGSPRFLCRFLQPRINFIDSMGVFWPDPNHKLCARAFGPREAPVGLPLGDLLRCNSLSVSLARQASAIQRVRNTPS